MPWPPPATTPAPPPATTPSTTASPGWPTPWPSSTPPASVTPGPPATPRRGPPASGQAALAERLLASPDIDLILGTHVHVVQPIGRVGGEVVIYGMGNQISNMRNFDG